MWNQAEQALNQSMSRMVTQLASLLPGIVAFLVAVLISGIAAWILAAAVRRCLVSLRFDERLNHSGLAAVTEWSPSRSPALLITRLMAWLVLIAGVLIGVTAFDAALDFDIPEQAGRLSAKLDCRDRSVAGRKHHGAVSRQKRPDWRGQPESAVRPALERRGEVAGGGADRCHGARGPQNRCRNRRTCVRYFVWRNRFCSRAGCGVGFERTGVAIAGARCSQRSNPSAVGCR